MNPFEARDRALAAALLVTLYERGEPMALSELEIALRCDRRSAWRAIRDQQVMGNVRGRPVVELTPSARFAIAAGRSASCDWRSAA